MVVVEVARYKSREFKLQLYCHNGQCKKNFPGGFQIGVNKSLEKKIVYGRASVGKNL